MGQLALRLRRPLYRARLAAAAPKNLGLLVAWPRRAFAKAAAFLHPVPPVVLGIFTGAVVAPDAQIGEGAAIGPQAVIGGGAEIGDNGRSAPAR